MTGFVLHANSLLTLAVDDFPFVKEDERYCRALGNNILMLRIESNLFMGVTFSEKSLCQLKIT